MEVDIEYNDQKAKGKVIQAATSLPSDGFESLKETVVIDATALDIEDSPGKSVRVSAVIERREGVIVLPRNVVRQYMGRYYVIILEDGLKLERDVEIGLGTPADLEIVKGVEAGEVIVDK